MAINTKAIKRRIKSVGNIKKITKAMELVSASKMRKSVEATLNSRAYASLAWELLKNLSKSVKGDIPLLKVRPIKKVLLILITSNRGLCGSFNSNIIKKTVKSVQEELQTKVETDVVGIGKKGAVFAKKNNYNLIASFDNLGDVPKFSDILPIGKIVINDYSLAKYDKVLIAYTDFISGVFQQASLKQVLPVSEDDLEEMQNETGNENAGKKVLFDSMNEYVFEPNKKELLNIILPRLVETQIYQAVLESAASEHSARMVAMKNANESANEMIDELKLTFNKARQAAITQEIAEIAGGAAALE